MADTKLSTTLDGGTRQRLTQREGVIKHINDIADQIQAESIMGNYDFRVSTEGEEHTLQKLVMALNFLIDVTRRAVEDEHRQRESLAQIQEELRALVAEQAAEIEVLSTPILEVWENVLALPVIGALDHRRAAEIMVQLLDAIVTQKASHVILDLTGVDMIDTHTAGHLLKLIRAIELLGAEALVSGIRPPVAQSIARSGLELGKVRTYRTLQEGLRQAMAERRRVGARRRRVSRRAPAERPAGDEGS
jgi:rsbT co-antagonist protein RsbR